jgi:hypothetical protein
VFYILSVLSGVYILIFYLSTLPLGVCIIKHYGFVIYGK